MTRSGRLFIPFIVGITGAFSLLSSGCAPKQQDVVLATVGPNPITLPEYEKLYIKSNGSREAGAAASTEDREKFLDLMVKYRLKLTDAYRQGLDKQPEIVAEMQQYKGSLAASFVTERELVAPGTRLLYNRRGEEIRASHILIGLSPDASAADSAAAYTKAYDAIAQLKAGKSFEEIALAYSQDPSVRQNNGDLYYFTAGQMVPAFEDAAFAMKVGETSTIPVRTQYGLHIIRVTQRQPARGEVQCSHIMIRFNSASPPPEDTLAAYQKARLIQDSVAAGVDFAELAKRNSGDMGSASRGGDLGWFGRRRWIQPFDEAALLLQAGQVSGIVRTPYGYHLIKCYETRPRKSFEESKAETQQLYQQLRFQEDFKNYVARLKKDFAFTQRDSVINAFIASCDSTKSTRDSAWFAGVSPALGKATAMTVLGAPISLDSVLAIIKSRPDFSNVSLRAASLLPTFAKVSEHLVFSAKADALERENPEFAAILKEYSEGILLYQVEQNNVWNRITSSDSLLRNYFDNHRDTFTFPDRVNFSEIRASNEASAKALQSQLQEGKTMEQVFVADSIRMKRPTRFQITFAKASAALNRPAKTTLASAADELNSETALKVTLIARPDTSSGRERILALTSKRLEAITTSLTKTYRLPADRITTVTKPQGAIKDGKVVLLDSAAVHRIDLELTGRQALALGPVQSYLLPVAADDRTKHADSLAVGAYSVPFYHRTNYYIVRLNTREPARRKTFEEAGAEVSSAFQEAESKRLTDEWIQGLRTTYPVVVHKEHLKDAFAPVR